MLSSAEVVLGGIVISIASMVVGNAIGGIGKVKDDLCGERRASCLALVVEKIDDLTKQVKALTTSVNSLLGL